MASGTYDKEEIADKEALENIITHELAGYGIEVKEIMINNE